MKTKTKLWLLPLVGVLLVLSCQENDFQLTQEDELHQQEDIFKNVLNQVAVIGDEIPNPYALDNMRKAYANLFPETKSSVDEVISATHHYVKFIPKCENDLTEIQKLEGLDLCLYPMDHEVSDGRIDVDPRYSVNGFQHRWCYVPVGYDLSGVQCEYEYLYDIYSPYDVAQTKAGYDFGDSLEVEAYRLCGMELKDIPQTKSGSVTPSGTLMFWDNDVNAYRGCKGLYVKAVRGTHSCSGICNVNGQFTINDTFTHSFTYQIHFAHTDFMLRRNDSTSEIVYKYSDYFGSLLKTFDNEDDASFFAKVNRAAYVYYYEYIDGLRRPPMANDSNSAKLAIQAVLDSFNGYTGEFSINDDRFIFSDRPIATVYQQNGQGEDFSHMKVFANTIHELTHAAHWRVDHDNYADTDKIVKESLATGIQWYLTNQEYPSGNYSPGYCRLSYTGVVEDLINGYGIVACDWYYREYDGVGMTCYAPDNYTDSVTGYTASEIEEAAIQSRTWIDWFDNILIDTTKTDRNHVGDAFCFWSTAD